MCLSAGVVAAISLLVLIIVHLLSGGSPNLNWFWLPAAVLPFFLLLAGTGWFLAAFGVFVRDIGHLTGLLVTVLLFISPIFIRIEAMPAAMRPWLYLNPLTVPVLDLRRILFDDQPPDWPVLLGYAVAAFLIAWIGYYIFARAKRAFADVI